MSHLSRHGIIAFLAAVVTTTSMAERSSSSQCTDGKSYFDVILSPASFPGGCGDFGTDPGKSCEPTVCPGMDVVVGRTNPFQRQDDFPGNYPVETLPRIISTEEIWVDGKKNETLQCFKSKGQNFNNVDLSDDGTETGTGLYSSSIHGHTLLAFFEDGPFITFTYKFSGLNTANITVPGLYYMQVSLVMCGKGYHATYRNLSITLLSL